MIHHHITDLVRRLFTLEPTSDQKKLMDILGRFIASPKEFEILLVKGFAGTGKTSLVATLVKVLPVFKIPVVLLAPTGRAAKVLAQFSGQPALTIHKHIYRQKASSDGFGDFVLDRNLSSNAIFIVDEASMIGADATENSLFGSGNLLEDLLRYVYNGRNCHLILIGDTAQLPPVGLSLSPALDPDTYKKYDFEVTASFLREVVRQQESSDILTNATSMRERIETGLNGYPQIRFSTKKEISRINGSEVVEEITRAYATTGPSETLVICRSNKQANRYNKGIRQQILGREEALSAGDMLMVVKNNYFWLGKGEGEKNDFIANGDVIRVKRVKRFEERYQFRFADITAVLPDYQDKELDVKVMLDILDLDAASLSSGQSRQLYQSVLEDYPEATSRKKQLEAIRADPFFNALQVKFSYAVTCHKAQGGQWQSVFIDQGWIDEKQTPDTEYLRWLYTAFTRATSKLYLVNFREEFFDQDVV